MEWETERLRQPGRRDFGLSTRRIIVFLVVWMVVVVIYIAATLVRGGLSQGHSPSYAGSQSYQR